MLSCGKIARLILMLTSRSEVVWEKQKNISAGIRFGCGRDLAVGSSHGSGDLAGQNLKHFTSVRYLPKASISRLSAVITNCLEMTINDCGAVNLGFPGGPLS